MSRGRRWARCASFAAVFAGLAALACERNAKLDPDADGGRDMVAADSEASEPAPLASVTKWLTPHGALLAVSDEGVVWTASRAGLLAFDAGASAGAPADLAVLVHHEGTLAAWPTDKPLTDLCLDRAGGLWLAVGHAFFLFDPGDTILDPSDDALVAAPDEAFPASRDILDLACRRDGPGVWVATAGGFTWLAAGSTPRDPSSWSLVDYGADGSALSRRPYASDVDDAGRVWTISFVSDTFALHAVEPGEPSDPGDDREIAVPFGLPEPSPSALVHDAAAGIWLLSDGRPWHLDPGGTLDEPGDDAWVELPLAVNVRLSAFVPLGPGRTYAVSDDGVDIYLLDTKGTIAPGDDAATRLGRFGLTDANEYVSAAPDPARGLWLSSRRDFSLLEVATDPAEGWTRRRFHGLGGVPGNDLGGFHAGADRVTLGGPNGLVSVSFDSGGHIEARQATGLDDPSGAPFDVATLTPVPDGLLAGGKWLAHVAGDVVSPWNASGAPSGASVVAQGPGTALWVSTLVQSFVPLINVKVYDWAGTPDASDDLWKAVSNDWFGSSSGAPVEAFVFYDGCRALVGNALGLHHYDCLDTPLDPSDDEVVTGLYRAGRPIRLFRHVGAGTFFLSSTSGLAYLDLASTADPADDLVVELDLPSPSSGFAWDGERLYYFAGPGLIAHDVGGTPQDPADDTAAVVPLVFGRSARVEVDTSGGVWFDFGDASGIRRAVLSESIDWRPLAEVLSD